VIAAVSFVFPWRELASSHIGTEAAFERAFGSRAIAHLIVFAAFLSLLKVFNGNFVAATRLLFAVGRRGLVHPSLARLHADHGTPVTAVLLVAGVTVVASFLGDAVLVPITEVGSLAAGVGWLSASLAYLARRRSAREGGPVAAAWLAVAVSLAIVLMKALPAVPGSFGTAEWTAFLLWALLGLGFWRGRRRRQGGVQA